jgi:hypothetical protein
MKLIWKIGLTVVLLALLAGVYFSRPGHAPAAQPALTELDTKTLSGLQTEFNRTNASLRAILLLSPT